jgi:hypothetical protein
VTVSDGQLTLRLQNLGRSYDIATIAALQIAGTADTVGPRVVAASPSGQVAGPVDRVTLTFSEPIRDGSFALADVASLTGPLGAIVPTAVNRIDATHYEVLFTPLSAAGSYSLTVGPDIQDEAGNAMDQDQDGVLGEASDDRYTASFTIASPPATAPSWRYDFGTAGSPVAVGYARVTAATTYSASAGYGWQSGAIDERDRGTGDDATRDFNFTADGTFAVDLADGTYDVTVTLGDADYAHGPMGVYLEGAQVDAVSTAAGQFAARTYRVTVSDGQLTLRLQNLGRSYDTATIAALQIAAVDDAIQTLGA